MMGTVLRAACLCLLAVACYSPDLDESVDAVAPGGDASTDTTSTDTAPPFDAPLPSPDARPADAPRVDAQPCAKSGCATLDCGDGVCRVRCLAPELTWVGADNDCRAWGGLLATIPDGDVTVCVRTTVPLWIGLNDRGSEDTFVWLDGTPLTYENWNGGEPDNMEGCSAIDSDCVRMLSTSGEWSDEACDGSRDFGYVCQR